MIKASVLQVFETIRPTETYIGQVSAHSPFKVMLGDKTIIEEIQIVWIEPYDDTIEIGTDVLLLRENGGQKFYLVGIIAQI